MTLSRNRTLAICLFVSILTGVFHLFAYQNVLGVLVDIHRPNMVVITAEDMVSHLEKDQIASIAEATMARADSLYQALEMAAHGYDRMLMYAVTIFLVTALVFSVLLWRMLPDSGDSGSRGMDGVAACNERFHLMVSKVPWFIVLPLLIISVIAAGVAMATGIWFWWAFLIVAIALLVNGFVIALEEDLPGGFHNPDGTATPQWVRVAGWMLRGLGAVLLLLSAAAIYLGVYGAR